MAPQTGFDVSPEQINPALKPHQRDAVIWACRGGRRALFESFGLGKTVQELEWCRLTAAHEGGRALIVPPLGVRQEFSWDAVGYLREFEEKEETISLFDIVEGTVKAV